ncbi:phospho-N-acetylmuramoyl-pentapeptide-transferase [Candidatus Saccharibacteria bacterium]|nr:phospho-N-acetylmuramoyl-pentapeptide-transferase [Candidatus Saccharibacteria bacterium]MCL1962801.1 phospho-N-acetylmuramoyl-pentapeptide-transferase [Candidatus Saccharibacteria bacterium]
MHETLTQITEVLAAKFPLGIFAFVLAMILTPIYTYFAYRFKFWKKQKTITLDGKKLTVMNKLHAHKIARRIPTMAGSVFVIAISVVTLIFNFSQLTVLPLTALVVGAVIGLIDDILNLRSDGGAAGLRAPIKFIMMICIGLAFGWFFWGKLEHDYIHIPFIGEWQVGFWIIPLFAFVVVATGNAVNIADGLDGLAGGLAAVAFGIFAIIALLQQNFGVMGFCITVVGALLSYLWFNIYPARFFMTDTGSLALGTSLGVVAMLTNCLFILPIIGIVFVIDTGSVIIQAFTKRFLHRKIWLSTPIHHHFEAIGWPEAKVTMRFWLVGIAAGIIGLIVALMGGNVQ